MVEAPSAVASGWNPFKSAAYMESAVEAEHRRMQDGRNVTVRVMDKLYQLAGFANDYIDIEFSFERNGAGGLELSLPGDSEIRDHLFSDPDGPDAVVPIVVDTLGAQWTGQVTEASIVVDENGVETIEISAIHDWDWCSSVAMWPSPFAPLIAQFPKRMFGLGPARSIIKTFYKANLLRLQLPLWRIPSLTDLFNPSAWFNLKNANFPVAVAPIDVLRDTSKWCAVSARMQMGNELFEQVLKDSGLSLTAKLFIPGEHPQPFKSFIELDRPTIVLDVEDWTGVTGPTGTVADGVLWWITELLDDGISQILHQNPEKYDGLEGNLVRDDALGTITNLLGFRQARPKAIWLDGQYTGIIDGRVDIHKPMCRDIIIGGRSPGWVNSAIEIGIQQLLNFAGTYLGVGGLSALYQGQLADVFMAWQRFTDQGRSKRAGPYLKHERVVANGSSAYTVSGFMEGMEGVFDTRGYTSKVIRVRDAAPFVFGVDVQIGEIVGFELDKTIWTDYLTKATFRDSRDERSHWELQIGDGSAEEADGVKAHRKLASVFGMIKDLATDTGADLGLEIF
ncbi:minor tail protein [Gordonia phage Lozinak]|uniref:Minor tail protein n=5 Tax=Smoothievirus TaxID=1982557 RepID=A0A2D1GG48_9CAUD|nr:minor tail protein [Gordonia phage Smoothie]YP_009273083.1 minor tail protein [Gordonia phage ClubL]YP_009276161.1 minor tail protein [Gordonia phage Bachita]YP_009281204.1 minor tail protein [Gordonia phage Cucurbita]ATN90674.1 minor tail protein [Gordonia phage Lozinak]AUE23617.1 minor tail protein [Gordonia phage Toniann]QAU06913.1 minor tail protein [Gordonia phage Aphelion]QKY79625.1 minor tail protein [Gordonia Phage Engineer]QYC53533.1 minor tail protein [Gordonia phage Norvs]WKW